MHGFMNEEALRRTIETGEAHYYSRSREAIWHKGATSGLVQNIVEMRIDDDQDCVWLRVRVGGKWRRVAMSGTGRVSTALCRRRTAGRRSH